MFFHIDESGNSGNNLFDENQPVLSYGVLSSRWNVDEHAQDAITAIARKIGNRDLHANKLGDAGLRGISRELVELHERFEFCFDYYYIHKPSFAVVTFFNAVFDSWHQPGGEVGLVLDTIEVSAHRHTRQHNGRWTAP